MGRLNLPNPRRTVGHDHFRLWPSGSADDVFPSESWRLLAPGWNDRLRRLGHDYQLTGWHGQTVIVPVEHLTYPRHHQPLDTAVRALNSRTDLPISWLWSLEAHRPPGDRPGGPDRGRPVVVVRPARYREPQPSTVSSFAARWATLVSGGHRLSFGPGTVSSCTIRSTTGTRRTDSAAAWSGQ